jgi:hypothetical protein
VKAVEPPPFARWVLEHCVPGGGNDAMAGDLVEQLRAGRTRGWYRRQVLGALALGWARDLGDDRALVVFALLWSVFEPAWWLLTICGELAGNFIGGIWLPPSRQAIDRQTLTLFNVIVKLGMPGAIGRIPSIFATLSAAWGATRLEKRNQAIAT